MKRVREFNRIAKTKHAEEKGLISPGSHKLLRQTNPGYKQFRVDNGYKVPGTGMEMTERIARLEEAIGEISKTQKEILNFVAR